MHFSSIGEKSSLNSAFLILITPEDVKAVVHEVLRHRIILTYEGEAKESTADNIIDKIISVVDIP